MSVYIDENELTNLYKKINNLEQQISQEREEHKEIYNRMRKNLMYAYTQNSNNKNDNEFLIYHIKQENTRLRHENENLKKN